MANEKLASGPRSLNVPKTLSTGKGPSSLSTAIYRVLVLVLVVATIAATLTIIWTAIQNGKSQRGPRTYAEAALSEAEAAVEKNPRSVKARIDLGKAYGNIGRYEDALHQFTMAGKLEPNNADVPYFMGAAYRQMGDYANTVKYLKKAAKSKNGQKLAR